MLQIPRMRPLPLPPDADLNDICRAFEAEPAILNSERIERRFGNCGIAVLRDDAGLRRSSVYSCHGPKRVCRTYAVVRFTERPTARYREEHAKILAGNSIGAVFRSHGWHVHKQTLHIGRLSLPNTRTEIAELMRLDDERELPLHVYQMLLARDEQIFEYATIMEAHHPAYLSEADLRRLYSFDKSGELPAEQVAELTSLVLASDE